MMKKVHVLIKKNNDFFDNWITHTKSLNGYVFGLNLSLV